MKRIVKMGLVATLSLSFILPSVACAGQGNPAETTVQSSMADTVPSVSVPDEILHPFMGSKKVPDFEIKDLEGKSYKVGDFAGKVVVFSFGATWCPDCKKEFPVLEELAKHYKDDPEVEIVPTLLLSTDKDGKVRESEETVKSDFVEKYPDVKAYVAQSIELKPYLKLMWIPTMYIMGPNGEAVEVGKDDKGEPAYYKQDNFSLEGIIDLVEQAKKMK